MGECLHLWVRWGRPIIANGRTLVRHPHVCVLNDGRTVGGARGRGHVGLVSRGYGRVVTLATGAPARQEKGRHMLRQRIKSGLTVLGLSAMLVLGAGSWGMATAAPQAPAQTYTGQVESIKVDHCDLQPGTCAGSLVLAQANDRQVDLAIPAGTVIQRGGQRVHLDELGVGNYVTVQATPVHSAPQGNGRDLTWGEIDAYEHSPIDSGNQGD